MKKLKKVISGGQTGVDIATWKAAKHFEFETGGFMPKGFLTLNGKMPEYKECYGARETDSANWNVRTFLNVRDADATLAIVTKLPVSRGTNLAIRKAREAGKPCETVYIYPLAGEIIAERLYQHFEGTRRFRHPAPTRISSLANWLIGFETLNIAGNRDADETLVYDWLVKLFETLKGQGE